MYATTPIHIFLSGYRWPSTGLKKKVINRPLSNRNFMFIGHSSLETRETFGPKQLLFNIEHTNMMMWFLWHSLMFFTAVPYFLHVSLQTPGQLYNKVLTFREKKKMKMQQPISRRVSLNISLDTNQKKRYDIKIRAVKNIGYNNNPCPKTGKYQVQGANKNSSSFSFF